MARLRERRVWKGLLQRTILLLVVAAVSLTWSESGRAQDPPCVIERGINPLDVLSTTIRHNVFIGLDNSGSMSNQLDGSNVVNQNPTVANEEDHPTARLRIAKDVLTEIITDADLNDEEGNPLVNWGFFWTARQNDGVGRNDPSSDNCAVPQRDQDGDLDLDSECVGLDGPRILPSTCATEEEARQKKEEVLTALLPVDLGGIENNGGTVNVVSMGQIAGIVARDYMPIQRPGQRNIIIFVSDGAEDCACQAEDSNGNPVFVDFPGAGQISPPSLRVDPSDPNVLDPVSTDLEHRAYNAGIRSQYALRTIDPPLDGSRGDIFTLLMAENSTAAEKAATHWGWEASGVSLGRPLCGPDGGLGCARPGGVARTKEDLIRAIKDILLQIEVPETTVSLGASVVGTVKELADVADPTLVSGDLTAASGTDFVTLRRRGELRNNVLFSTSVDTPGFRGHLKAFNVFAVQNDGTRVADTNPDPIWDAGVKLQNRLSTSRQIFFNRAVPPGTPPPAPLDFIAANLLPTDLGVQQGDFAEFDPAGLGARSDEDAVAIVVNLIRGQRLVSFSPLEFSEFEEDGVTPTWKLFEALNSAPAIVQQPPRRPDLDPIEPVDQYTAFFEQFVNRLTMVYLGTNGAMVQAFRGDNGEEDYAYVPHDFLPRLKLLARNILAGNGLVDHQNFVASSVTVQDVFLQGSPSGRNGWRTLITFGRGPGGKFVTAIDVTEVGEWDGGFTPPSGPTPLVGDPQLIFNVGNRDGVDDPDGQGENYDGLGEVWSIPVMGRVRTQDVAGQWVAFVGSGYGCPGTEEGRFLYVLKLEDGTVYRKAGPIPDVVGPTDEGIDQNVIVATPALFNPHIPGTNDGQDYVKFAYVGDLQGFVHKLDASNPDPATWVFDVFFEVTSQADQQPGQGAHNQPITAQAAILKLPADQRIFIYLGTGGDGRVTLPAGQTFKLVGLEDTGNFDGQLITDTTSGEPFFFDAEEGERVNVAPVTARNDLTNGIVFFASSGRGFDVTSCGIQFVSTLYAFGATQALGVFDGYPETRDGGGIIPDISGRITGLVHRDEHLFVSKSGGIGLDPGTEVRGSEEFPEPGFPSDATVQILVDSYRISPF